MLLVGDGAGRLRPTVEIEMGGDAVAVNLALMAGVLNKEDHVCIIRNSTGGIAGGDVNGTGVGC